MMWIRTIKNKYNLDVIIDSTGDEEFTKTSGLNWIMIDENVSNFPENGAYFCDNKVIPINSDDYEKIIVPRINEFEEPLRIEREKIIQEETEKILLELEKLNSIEPEEPTDFIPPQSPDPKDAEKIQELSEKGLLDPRKFPKPTAHPILDVESTEENFEIWYEKYLNLSSLIDALVNKKYSDIVENVVIFDPPHKFPCGVEQSNFAFPEDTVEEYIDYLSQVRSTHKDLLDTICGDLGLPLIES